MMPGWKWSWRSVDASCLGGERSAEEKLTMRKWAICGGFAWGKEERRGGKASGVNDETFKRDQAFDVGGVNDGHRAGNYRGAYSVNSTSSCPL
jgi:hypothetical protein